jgi:hypothetical protein
MQALLVDANLMQDLRHWSGALSRWQMHNTACISSSSRAELVWWEAAMDSVEGPEMQELLIRQEASWLCPAAAVHLQPTTPFQVVGYTPPVDKRRAFWVRRTETTDPFRRLGGQLGGAAWNMQPAFFHALPSDRGAPDYPNVTI